MSRTLVEVVAELEWRETHPGQSPLRNRRPNGTSSPETTIVSARLTPAELAALDAQRRPGETRTDVVRRLLVGPR